MIYRILTSALIIPLVFVTVFSQSSYFWNDKKCAVVLTYDDALNVHLDNVIPLLDSLGFRATFYISALSLSLKDRLQDWELARERDHELGNHTLFHPCEGKSPGREWVNPTYDLSSYSIKRITDEISITNILLKAIDGRNERTFAYPCGDTKVGDISYVDKIKEEFIAGRGIKKGLQKISDVDLYNINGFIVNNNYSDELISLVNQAVNENALLVFIFHGVGGEHSINIALEEHRKLLYFLKQNEKKFG